MNKFIKCLSILFKTKTRSRYGKFWIISSVFLALLFHPRIFSKKNWRGEEANILSKYLPHQIIVCDPHGIWFIARPNFEDLARYLFGETLAKWEPRSLINPNELHTFVDVGSNTGYYTQYIAKKNTGAKIISIEADPETIDILQQNCKLNSLSNVKIYNFAVSNKKGKLSLYKSTNSGANSTILVSDESNQIQVDSDTLDSILESEKLESIDWIKIDVEGAELFVLQGSPNTLKKTKKILIEVHEHILKHNNQTSQDILKFLKYNGFKINLFPKYWNSLTSPNQDLKSDYILAER